MDEKETEFKNNETESQKYVKRKEGIVSREEWLSENETGIHYLWEGMLNYLRDTNSFLLDSCTYIDFSNFVAQFSTHVGESYYQ